MFRPDLRSRRDMLAAMKGLVFSGPPLPKTSGGAEDQTGLAGKPFCLDPPGRDLLATPSAILAAACGDCKKLSILAARRYIEAGARRVELCMTVEPQLEQEHVFLRVDGRIVDPAVDAGMPVRQVGEYIAEQVWPLDYGS
jgi:hypothetical protein